MIVHFTEQVPIENRLLLHDPLNLEWIDGSGNISCLVSAELAETVRAWTQEGEQYYVPRTSADLMDEGFENVIELLRFSCSAAKITLTAFPAEMEWERRQEGRPTLDEVSSTQDQGEPDIIKRMAEERSMLEEIPLPGTPVTEAERLAKWLKIPRDARGAIRRLYSAFGYPVNSVLVQILQNAKAAPEFIEAAKHFKGDETSITQKLPKQTHKVSLPKPFEFNHTIGIDVNYIADASGQVFKCPNIACLGTDMQLEVPLNAGLGTP